MSFKTASCFAVVSMLWINNTTASQWTLQSSLQHAMATSPVLEKSLAEINIKQAEIALSGLWPDPSVEFRVDNQLGKEDNSGGYDLTDITVSQAIPVSRLQHQSTKAQADLHVAKLAKEAEVLRVQNRVARMFYKLQLASAQFTLASQQLKLATRINKLNQSSNNTRPLMVRYLSPLEKMRLSILREEAQQAFSHAEGKYREAKGEFIKLLGLPEENIESVGELLPLKNIPSIQQLTLLQDSHAQILAQQQRLLVARHEIDVARSQQQVDPVISISKSRDVFSGGRDDIYAVMLNISIPLHDRKDKAASKASYQAGQQRIELGILKRELKINLNQSHIHLQHLVEQAKAYQQKILKPSQKILDLTEKGFRSGELGLLNLIDASKTFYESRMKYLQLIYAARVEYADLMYFSGQLTTSPNTLAVHKAGEDA